MNSKNIEDTKLWLMPISFALNKLRTNDESFASKVSALEGRTILFHIDGIDIRVFAAFRHNGIELHHDLPRSVDSVDVTLRGRVKDFIALARQQREGQSTGAGQVEIQGDLHTAQAVQNLIKNIEIDLEELIARATNDAFAHAVGSFARRTATNIRQGLLALEQDFGDYMHYEKRLTPTAAELHEFAEAVDELALDVERLELRVKQLASSDA